ncbi:amidohydrolase family protein [Paenibacillus sp. GCM10012303]|uniref:N-acyl-D-amino-acid deacylase family protein n=1 Tax=Paenibacillus sp. GCM10012303 TaxID=3317340 RepID=UPI00361F3C21
MECELLIENGILIDGTGSRQYAGGIAVDQGKIVAVGDTAGIQAAERLDARGCAIAPGFIDVHVHSEKELVGGPDRWAGIRQGVTTQLIAPDGFSWSHLDGSLREEMRQYLEVFYGDTPAEWGGATVSEFLSLFAGKLPSHLALQVPHGAIRASVMGWSTATADDGQLAEMKKLVKEWMEAGAKSFCTGLEYEPTVHADLRELVELSKVTAEYGGVYVAHQRGNSGHTPFGTDETIEIGKRAGIPVHISHFTVDDVQARNVRRAEAEGVDLSFDMYPYPAGCTHLLYYLPPWAQAGSPSQVKERLASGRDRERMSGYLSEAFPPERLRCATVKAERYKPYIGMMLADIVKQTGMPLPELICDMLLESDLQALFIYHWDPVREPFLEHTYKHPRHMVSTDGIFVSGSPHPRGYGTYPRILGSFVREKGWLTMEEAVRKMSGYPAERFGLHDRGRLATGKAADLVVFDPAVIRSDATFENPRVAPEGIAHVLVAGTFVVRNGAVTGALPGQVIGS